MENGTPDIVQAGVVERLTSAERRSQIEVAKQYPREISAFKKRALEMATADEETAASCFYSIPRAGKSIEGPTVRLAEIIVYSWGNIRAQARVIDANETHITAEGVAWDLETNAAVSVSVQRRITGKDGKRYSDDMVTVTGNAAAAIAFRNAVFKVVPFVYVKEIYHAARRVAVGDASTLARTRGQWIEKAAKFGIPAALVCAAFGRGEVEDLTLDDLKDLAGRLTAVKDGEVSVDEAFAVEEPGNGAPNLPPEGRRPFGFKRQATTTPPTGPKDPKPAAESEPGPTTDGIDPGEQMDPATGEVTPEKGPQPYTRDSPVAVAKIMIEAVETVVELDKIVDGDTRKTIRGLYSGRRYVLKLAEAKASMGRPDDEGPPPHTDDELF